MRVNITVIIALLIFCALAAIYDLSRTPGTSTPSLPSSLHENKEQVPFVSLTDIDGESFSTHDFRGKIVLLNFWASWCVPCLKEFPSMLRLTKDFDGKIVFKIFCWEFR